VRSLPSLAAAINAEHDSVERAALSAVEHARRAGALLVDAKAQLDHGAWLPWLAANCPSVSKRTAQAYMRLAKANAQRVAHLTVREALALLSTPNERETNAPPCGDEETVPLSELVVTDDGWTYQDAAFAAKLEASLRKFGQINPLLVRTTADSRMVIDGRKRLTALTAIGARAAKVRDVGAMSDVDATELALSAMLASEVDFAALAHEVCGLVKAGTTPDQLAAIGPFDTERIQHFLTLHSWDWSLFRQPPAVVDNDDCRPPRMNPETEFRCPACAYEWSGQPKPALVLRDPLPAGAKELKK